MEAVWREQRGKLADEESIQEFNQRIVRQWSIETGILERIYTLDRGVTVTLIEKGFDAALIPHGSSDLSADRLTSILRDHKEAIDGLFSYIRQDRNLSLSYVLELHQVLTRHQETAEAVDHLGNPIRAPLVKGDWKKWPNNPRSLDGEAVHEYCPPEHTVSEMERLIEMHKAHGEVAAEVEAAWLHHRFTQIHPFQDGNGRVARSLASMVLIRSGGFPLVVTRDQKAEYISALEDADEGNLDPLVGLFSTCQKAAFVQALGFVQEFTTGRENLKAIVEDAAQRLEAAVNERQSKLQARSNKLADVAYERMQEVSKELNSTIRPRIAQFEARAYRSGEAEKGWFSAQIVETARHLSYFANLSGYRSFAQLRIREQMITSIVVAFHHVGRIESGVMAAIAFVWRRASIPADAKGKPPKTASQEPEATDSGDRVLPSEPACTEPFTITAGMDESRITSEFKRWLERVLTIGLETWRRKL